MNSNDFAEWTDQLRELLEAGDGDKVVLSELLERLAEQVHPRVLRVLLGVDSDRLKAEIRSAREQSEEVTIEPPTLREQLSELVEELDHPYVGTEHLVIVLTGYRDDLAGEIWDSLEIRPGMVKARVRRTLFPEI